MQADLSDELLILQRMTVTPGRPAVGFSVDLVALGDEDDEEE